MPTPRSCLVALDATPYYHCIGRCVRRAFLCGIDQLTGRSFEHRRGWIVELLGKLSRVFALDVCSYAVMNNHYHLVLKINTSAAQAWTMDEVLNRWCQIFSGHQLAQRYLADQPMTSAELAAVQHLATIYRSRLADLSWFMRCLNEPIARMANAEDNCTGRFWEGRFKSQAILDEPALISCMAYVDLNPIRAGIATSPETSDFTSIQQRIKQTTETALALDEEIPRLLGFSGKRFDDQALPYTLTDYLTLVDWSGRAIHPDKKGSIHEDLPPIIIRLGIDPVHLLRYLDRKEQSFVHAIGSHTSIQSAAVKLGKAFLKGVSAANRLFPSPC